MRTRSLLKIFVLSAALTACSADHSMVGTDLASSAAVSPEKVQAFEATLYSWGQAQNCVKCHADKVNPYWMNPNVNTAYNFARSLVDMNNPTASIFATYASNNHCLESLCANAANKAAVQDLLTQWAAVENTEAMLRHRLREAARLSRIRPM